MPDKPESQSMRTVSVPPNHDGVTRSPLFRYDGIGNAIFNDFLTASLNSIVGRIDHAAPPRSSIGSFKFNSIQTGGANAAKEIPGNLHYPRIQHSAASRATSRCFV